MAIDIQPQVDDTALVSAFTDGYHAGQAMEVLTPPAEQQQDLYQWRVVYRDGSLMDEYDAHRPDGRGFAEVTAGNVGKIVLAPAEQFYNMYEVSIPDGAEPVFFRRRYTVLNPNTGTTGQTTAHCIGWKRQEQGVYLFVFESGDTLLTSEFQAV